MRPFRINRRSFLRVGTLAGLGLPELLRFRAAAAPADAKSRDINCIFIFTIGGMSHHDLWDYKAGAPVEIRGDFKAIRTNVPGITLTELLPGISRVTDKIAILRGMTHADSDHGRGFHIMMTGAVPGPGDFNATKNNNVHPSLGSMVARMGGGRGPLPPYISVPCFLRSGGPSFLGPAYAPFVIEADPAAPDFVVRDVVLPPDESLERNRRRLAALGTINHLGDGAQQASKDELAVDTFYHKALSLMTSQQAKDAFDIRREKEATRAAYGMTSAGQCCLLARRLVEAGCRFVTIENGHWDTHRDNSRSLRDLLVPGLDRALSTLLSDLQDRGLLDNTLVVLSTEFGRTPRINSMAGRDHWPNAFSIVLAGGGVRGGRVIGSTDKIGGSVADRPVTPGDMAATVLKTLGIDPNTIVHTPLGRPVELAGGGKPVTELF
jgi:uncharacterized protein (DUF1501 family)